MDLVLATLIAGALLAGAISPAAPRAFQVLVFVAMSYALWDTGARLCGRLVPDWAPLNRAVATFSLAVGLAVVPATWMGHFGVLRPAPFLVWTAAAYLLSRLLPGNPAPAPDPAIESARNVPVVRVEIALLLAAALALAVVGVREVQALRYQPPLSFDDLSYHLSDVATWIRHGDLRMIRFSMGDPSTPFYPILGEMTSWVLIAPFRDSDVAARWTELLFAVFSFLAVAALARRLDLSRRDAALAALAYAGIQEIFPDLAMTAGNDHSTCFFTLAAVDASLGFARRPGARTGVVTGAALGLLLATKYVGVLFAPVIFAVLLLALIVERRRSVDTPQQESARWRTGLAVLCAVVLVAGGYTYLRNGVTTGNPLFPAPLRIFGRDLLPGWDGILASERTQSPEFRIDVWRFLTRRPDLFGSYFPFTLLPAALLAPLAALERRRWRELLVFSLPAIFFLQFLFLMPIHLDNRYVLPGIAIAAVAFAWEISRVLPLRVVVLLWIAWQAVWRGDWTVPEKTATLLAVLAGGALLEILWRQWRTRRPSEPLRWRWLATMGLLLIAGPLGRLVATYQQVKLAERPGPRALERLAGPHGTRIAYAGLNAPYLFFGSRFQNDVEIVPRTRQLDAQTYRWRSPLGVPYEVRSYRPWRTNLDLLKIEFVVIHRSPWEKPERLWMMRRPGEFQRVYADPEMEIWRVLPRSAEDVRPE